MKRTDSNLEKGETMRKNGHVGRELQRLVHPTRQKSNRMPQYLVRALNPGLSPNENMVYPRTGGYFIEPCAISHASGQYFSE